MVKKGLHTLILVLFATWNVCIGQDTTKTRILKDNPIFAALDSMAVHKALRASKFTADIKKLNKHKYKEDEVPTFDKAHYVAALKELDKASPFDLVYNESVKAYIDAYVVRNRDKVGRLLGLAELYYPLFEETLDRYKLPLELKHLAVIESALNPNAVSKSGATGLWQFMYRTGKIYDLNSTSYVDDRCDPYQSTVAACEYFKFLYGMFGDWQMVLAAYNGGPGTLLKAIRRAGGKRTYWEVRPYLPQETQGYVPAFIAVNYMMKHAADHNIYPVKPDFFAFEIDTVMVRRQTNLSTVAALLQMPKEQLVFLNPIYKHDIIPENTKGLPLTLPKKKIGVYLSNLEDFYEIAETKVVEPVASQVEIMKEVRKTHRVKSGETLSGIAARYRVSVSDLRTWNKIRGSVINVGQNLVVYAQTAAPSSSTSSSSISEKPKGEAVYYVVKAGDTLWDIAKKNGMSVDQLKELNNITGSYQLKIGDKLKIG
ncbi:MAG: LysM peptidoglycan-binding domain-containing protein [Flavobacteriales bacterium]|nr:LysM peptidoglycan-binding domain-containing protein [Flavobacteriales bacterium]